MSTPTNAPANGPEHAKEVRLAIVMYGGVSLAIYINCIAQELLRLVRSTAGKQPVNLSGTERIYRQVSYLLEDENMTLEELDKAKCGYVCPATYSIRSGHTLRNFSRRHQRHLSREALANGQDMEQLKDHDLGLNLKTLTKVLLIVVPLTVFLWTIRKDISRKT